MTSIGARIKKHRKAKGLSLDGLAKKADTSKSYIWELENRETHDNPTADKLIKISEALDIPVDYLLNDDCKLTEDVKMKHLFRKFNKLKKSDREKIEQIIELFLNRPKEVKHD